jgi:hypothetical protein
MVLVSHTQTGSQLRATDFVVCQQTIETLIHQPPTDATTLGRVQRLAMNYHRVSFTLEDPAHAFLLLMVVFEGMCKKSIERNAAMAAYRMGRLAGTTQAECGDIVRQFYHDSTYTFCRIRNDIAHGDTTLSQQTVTDTYPCLYRYVTTATTRLLNLTSGPGPGYDIDTSLDYYDQIEAYVDRRFATLPVT